MIDQLRDQILAELKSRRVAVVSASGEFGPSSQPVQYWLNGLEVECLLPRWSELAYALTEESDRVIMVVLSTPESDQRWVRYQGRAVVVESPDWAALLPWEKAPADRYYLIRISPERIDLIDEGQGWGARQTLDLP